ncbi:MAG: SRPBCC family protein [Aeromicrobium sp.]
MSRFARSIRIAVPSADVWAAIVDVEAWPAWASQFRSLGTARCESARGGQPRARHAEGNARSGLAGD